ncbi:hypothetical protein PABG_12601 [Paracoccidioides brasiliensis Pb03]|nr:hypothetical protein PABG_12601 [Paracoccidioides brasiliensis Pb03]
MSSRTQAAGPLDTPASNNMNRDEHEYNTPISEPRGETGLRDWQQEFVRIKLDDFYAIKQSPIQNLNLDELMDQLATHATTTTTHPNPSAANAATE